MGKQRDFGDENDAKIPTSQPWTGAPNKIDEFLESLDADSTSDPSESYDASAWRRIAGSSNEEIINLRKRLSSETARADAYAADLLDAMAKERDSDQKMTEKVFEIGDLKEEIARKAIGDGTLTLVAKLLNDTSWQVLTPDREKSVRDTISLYDETYVKIALTQVLNDFCSMRDCIAEQNSRNGALVRENKAKNAEIAALKHDVSILTGDVERLRRLRRERTIEIDAKDSEIAKLKETSRPVLDALNQAFSDGKSVGLAERDDHEIARLTAEIDLVVRALNSEDPAGTDGLSQTLKVAVREAIRKARLLSFVKAAIGIF